MARLTAAERRALPKSDFAVPSRAPGPGSFPIPDKSHAAAAKRLAPKDGPGAVSAVASAIRKKFGV